MSNKLKRNYIQLINGEKEDGSPKFDTYLTSPNQISVDVWDETLDVMDELALMEDEAEEARKKGERISMSKMMKKQRDLLMDAVVKIYDGQFTKEKLKAGLHAPEMIETLQSQVEFIATGQQDEATKKFVASKR